MEHTLFHFVTLAVLSPPPHRPDALAATAGAGITRPGEGQRSSGGDIRVNTKYEWDAYPGNKTSTEFDLYRVMLHELGHLIGMLGHPDEQGLNVRSIMNADLHDTYAIQDYDIAASHSLSFFPSPFDQPEGRFPVFSLVSNPPVVAQIQDISGPRLLSFSFSPNQIDTSNGPQTVQYVLEAEDDLSGFGFFTPVVSFEHELDVFTSADRRAPDQFRSDDGRYIRLTGEIVFNQFMRQGVYVASISMQDALDNARSYDNNDLRLRGDPYEVMNGSPIPTPQPQPTQPQPTQSQPVTPTMLEDPNGPDLVMEVLKFSHNKKHSGGERLRLQLRITNAGVSPVLVPFFMTVGWTGFLSPAAPVKTALRRKYSPQLRSMRGY